MNMSKINLETILGKVSEMQYDNSKNKIGVIALTKTNKEINQEVTTKLRNSVIELREILTLVKEANTNDNQLDYVTNPSLVNEFDNVANVVKQLDKILYQK
ncbi:hypothetical protein CN918_28735 [Priestia megaterium]|nr:hypothetical protein CN918_28735 [Priestia megaterium]